MNERQAHNAPHLWIRLHTGVCCAYMLCAAEPSPAEIARLEAQEVRRRVFRTEIRLSH